LASVAGGGGTMIFLVDDFGTLGSGWLSDN
jgi:hypothetical protein